MPGLGLGLHQRAELRQALVQNFVQMLPGNGVEEFRTDEEKSQISQYDILKQLDAILKNGEFIDKYHFSLELNRNIFGHPLETRLGDFGREIENIIDRTGASEDSAKEVISLLGSQKEDSKRKDIPGQIASSWNKISSSAYLFDEEKKSVPALIKYLAESNADIANGLDIISQSVNLGQKELVGVSFRKVREYAGSDVRIIPFANSVLSPVFKALNERKDEINVEVAKEIYEGIVESLYMLDRDLRIPGSIQKIKDSIKQNGLKGLLSRNLPVPIQTSLDNITGDEELKSRISLLCTDSDFAEGREIKRKVYRGIYSLEDLAENERVLDHISRNVNGSKQFSSILGAISLVSHDADFIYNFDLVGEENILRNLRLQLTDKSIKKLKFDDSALEKYVKRLENDERFEGISKIATTLAGYHHYNDQIPLLREILQAELDGKFNEWRYNHDKSKDQLRVLEDEHDSWKNNSKVVRLVGELDALKAHIESAKDSVNRLFESYCNTYNVSGILSDEQLGKNISENEEKLRNEELSKNDRKELGYQTALLREQLAYSDLINKLKNLNVENYQDVLEVAEKIAKKKSKNPLYNDAVWICDILDQPVYRDARKISVIETDDLESLLRMGEKPIPHCQDWRKDSSFNGSLLSFVADSNKKLYHIADENGKPFGMSLVRLVDWNNTPTLLIENIYSNEWSNDYGVALLGSIADKAAAINEETGKEVRIAIPYESGHDGHDTNVQVADALEKFSSQYKSYIHEDRMNVTPALSKNNSEYWDCGPGKVSSGSHVSINVKYLRFGEE